MQFCLIFGAFLRELNYFKLRSCSFTKLLQKISGNFNEVCGFLILMCAVFVRISVRFCADSHAPSPPLRTPLLSLKFTLLNHNFQVQCNSNYLFFTNILVSKLFSSAIRAIFTSSCMKAVFGLA